MHSPPCPISSLFRLLVDSLNCATPLCSGCWLIPSIVQEKVSETVQEMTLHTEDIEDLICVVKSMEKFGLPIADEMIKDIYKSLLIINSSQPKRGLIENPSWGFQFTQSGSNILETSNSVRIISHPCSNQPDKRLPVSNRLLQKISS